MASVEAMSLQEGFRHMARRAGRSLSDISRALGRVDSFLSSSLHNMSIPKTDLLVRLASECGYDVLLVGRGEALRVETLPDGLGGLSVRRAYGGNRLLSRIELVSTASAGTELDDYGHVHATDRVEGRVLGGNAFLRHMMGTAGLGIRETSRALGKTNEYMSSRLSGNTTPSIALFERIARICGYQVFVCGHGESYLVTAGGKTASYTLSDPSVIFEEGHWVAQMGEEEYSFLSRMLSKRDFDLVASLGAVGHRRESDRYVYQDASGKDVAASTFDADGNRLTVAL